MAVAKPLGGYAEQMLAPDAWPELDEDTYHDRALQYTEVLRKLTEVLETCQHEQSDIFDGGFWSGGAAVAAKTELGANIDELKKLQNGLATVITWHRYVADSITQAKWDIIDNVEAAQTEINALENDSSLDAAERTAAINTVVGMAYGANLGVVAGTAERIVASKSWKPPHNALQDLLDQKTPPPVILPDTPPPAPAPPVEEERPRPSPAQPAPVTPPPAAPPLSPPGMPTPGGGAQPPPGMPPLGQPAVPPAARPGGPGPAVPGAPGGPGVPGVPGGAPPAPLSPAASAQPLGSGGRGKGMTPASLMSSSVAPRPEETAAAAPAAPGGVPAGPMGASGGGSRGGARGGGAGSAPAGQKPTSASATTRPAAASNRSARPAGIGGLAGDPASSAERAESMDAVVVTPIIPVSKARAERDAIADAATADAARRQGGGSDPVRLARRIAAALNAPRSGAGADLGFFWVTAVTTDGAIVVANSYGIAYIPDGVQLPEQVQMASADEAISAAERAQWATYPMMAVQGWAAHHDTKLRAVIATEDQLANSDTGAAKIVLKADDIPDTGDMIGRSRLEVVDPEAAERLAVTTDVRLVSLLPPAPADATLSADQHRAPEELIDPETAAEFSASLAEGKISLQESPEDAGPPADQRPMLWFDVMKPLASRSPGRQAAHLRAFHSYAEHAQDILLTQAHTALDPAAQRSAVADWLYWKHLTDLLNAALTKAA